MCMMCEQEAMYQAYLDWLAKKEAEEAAAAVAAGTEPSGAARSPEPAPGDGLRRATPATPTASGFICDGPAEE